MPKQIDLEPHEFRRKGLERFRDFAKRHRLFTWLGAAAGVWGGAAAWLSRNGHLTDNLFLALVVVFAPAVAVMLAYQLLTERDS